MGGAGAGRGQDDGERRRAPEATGPPLGCGSFIGRLRGIGGCDPTCRAPVPMRFTRPRIRERVNRKTPPPRQEGRDHVHHLRRVGRSAAGRGRGRRPQALRSCTSGTRRGSAAAGAPLRRPRRRRRRVQDTFVAVWARRAGTTAAGEVGAWIWGIAIRRLIDALRRRPARESCTSERTGGRAVRRGAGAARRRARRPRRRARPPVARAARGGPGDRARRPDVAGGGRMLGIPAGTVKTRMMRARAQLRKELA